MATFPAAVWDGLTGGSRLHGYDDIDPDQRDWTKLLLELQAIQTHLLALKDQYGGINLLDNPTKGTDPQLMLWSTYFSFTVKDIILPVGASAVASVNLGYDIPANSIVFGCAMNIETVITLATATKIGLGIAGTLAKYATVTGGAANTKSTKAITPTAIASAEDVILYATDNSSAAAGTIQNGSVRVRLLIGTQLALPDA